MRRKNLNKTNQSADTWKKLAPKTSRKPATKAALKKRLLLISKFCIFFLILGIVGVGAWLLSDNKNFTHEPFDLTGPSVQVSDITFNSDGALNSQWFNNWFGPLRSRTLMDLNIEDIQSELMNEPQIIFARVSRNFPSTLEIDIRERKPILRLCLRSKSDGEQIWLVSKDGLPYKGQCYRRSSLSHLPFLNLDPSLLKLDSKKKGFKLLVGVSEIAPLLELARKDYPGFYRDWQIVSYHRPYDRDPGAHVSIKSKSVKKLRFAPFDYNNQLRRLKFLFSDPKINHATGIDTIDLSHDRSVFAKLSPS